MPKSTLFRRYQPLSAAMKRSLNRVSFKRKVLLTLPLPIGCYFLVRGLFYATASNNADYPMVGGIIRELLIMEGLLFLVVFLYTCVQGWRAERSSAPERR